MRGMARELHFRHVEKGTVGGSSRLLGRHASVTPDALGYFAVSHRGHVTNAIADALEPVGARVVEQYLPPSGVLELARVLCSER
jgi:hypothetical protein